jgi:hypothetical protein
MAIMENYYFFIHMNVKKKLIENPFDEHLR